MTKKLSMLATQIKRSNIALVTKILELYPDSINRPDTTLGYTSLHEACYYRQRPILQLLLDAGADYNIQKNNGDTPLHMAAFRAKNKPEHRQEYIDMFRMLVQKGARTDIKETTTNRTALQLTEKCPALHNILAQIIEEHEKETARKAQAEALPSSPSLAQQTVQFLAAFVPKFASLASQSRQNPEQQPLLHPDAEQRLPEQKRQHASDGLRRRHTARNLSDSPSVVRVH